MMNCPKTAAPSKRKSPRNYLVQTHKIHYNPRDLDATQLFKLNTDKCVSHQHDYGIILDETLKPHRQCTKAAKSANSIMRAIKASFMNITPALFDTFYFNFHMPPFGILRHNVAEWTSPAKNPNSCSCIKNKCHLWGLKYDETDLRRRRRRSLIHSLSKNLVNLWLSFRTFAERRLIHYRISCHPLGYLAFKLNFIVADFSFAT